MAKERLGSSGLEATFGESPFDPQRMGGAVLRGEVRSCHITIGFCAAAITAGSVPDVCMATVRTVCIWCVGVCFYEKAAQLSSAPHRLSMMAGHE